MSAEMANLGARLVRFAGGEQGLWRVTHQKAVTGAGLPDVGRLAMATGADSLPGETAWVLTGVRSNERYVERAERGQLVAVQEGLGRPQALQASLIPIKKSDAWWALTQDERRDVFEAQSQHIAGCLKYLPAVARQLHHCRDLGGPFDFLTWFEFAPEHAPSFDDMLAFLRASPEWRFVEREVELRLSRE